MYKEEKKNTTELHLTGLFFFKYSDKKNTTLNKTRTALEIYFKLLLHLSLRHIDSLKNLNQQSTKWWFYNIIFKEPLIFQQITISIYSFDYS